MALVFTDIETFSATNLKESGVYRYVEDPTFEILMGAGSIDGEPAFPIMGERRVVDWFTSLWNEGHTFVAHNAAFERICFSTVLGLPVGDYLDPERWIDPAAIAAGRGLPRDLKALAEALGAPAKDEAGTRLINTFSKPVRGTRVSASDKPEQWLEFRDYCVQDVDTLVGVYKRLPGGWQTPLEEALWLVDQHVNDRGVAVDVELATAAVESGDRIRERLLKEAVDLTGLVNPNSTQQLQGWLASQGVELPNLRAETVSEALTYWELPEDAERMLQIRQETALAAVKKFNAARNRTCSDGRFRGAFKFHGAHTGRWSGQGVQLQNLPRLTVDDVEAEIAAVKAGEDVSQQTLKALVRPMFTGPFTIVDYSAIEARVLAWLAGEQWVLDAFEEGRDLYVENATRMGPTYVRQQGKTAELACGFGGGVGALRRMGATEETNEELEVIRDLWRANRPRTTAFWHALGLAFRQMGKVGKIKAIKSGKDVLLWLPSGRCLTYRDVWQKYDPVEGWKITFADPRGFRTETWHGSLVENVTQAVARDILAAALVRLHDLGYPVVMHIHDEVVIEGLYDVDEIAAVMCELEPWMSGLPLAAEGQQSDRYAK